MRVRNATPAAAALLGMLALSGCGAEQSSTLTLDMTGDESVDIAIDDVRCLDSDGKFTGASAERSGDLPVFVATFTAETENSSTWVKVDDDTWFLTTEPFGMSDGTITFDQASGQIGESADGGYPTTFDGAGTLVGSISCNG